MRREKLFVASWQYTDITGKNPMNRLWEKMPKAESLAQGK
jgi:hypothetical protein